MNQEERPKPGAEPPDPLEGWSRRDLAHIADKSETWVKSHLDYGNLPDPGTPGTGHRRRFSAKQALQVIQVAALTTATGMRPSRAWDIIRNSQDTDFATLGFSRQQSAKIREHIIMSIDRARKLRQAAEEEKTRKKDLLTMVAQRRTKIERGHCEFAGVCVHGRNILLISPGSVGPAYAATLADEDARILLGEMDRELERGEDPPRTFVRTFEQANAVAVFIGQPCHIAIGAGEQGAIVAELTRDDFVKVRDALAASLRYGTQILRLPALAVEAELPLQ